MKKNYFNFKSKKGFMVLEILIAASIITMTILASSSITQKSIAISRQSIHAAQASFLLEEGAEAVRVYRDNTWSNISGMTVGSEYYPEFSGGTWTFSTTPSTIDIFTRKVVVANVNRDATSNDIVTSGGVYDSGTKLFTVTVLWEENGQTITKTLSFYLADIFS
ncbi:MAG: hypothetical protein AAB438_02270 [Patescibacteria group bacterium]